MKWIYLITMSSIGYLLFWLACDLASKGSEWWWMIYYAAAATGSGAYYSRLRSYLFTILPWGLSPVFAAFTVCLSPFFLFNLKISGALSVLQADLAHEREVTRPLREALEGV